MVFTMDNEIAVFLNKVASHSPSLNQFERFVSDNNLIKCGGFMVAIWWLWFRNDKNAERSIHNRQVIIGILLGCLVAMFVTRVLTHTLPHRTRPLYATELHLVPLFTKPAGVDTSTSFPSDHATLFCALATGFFFLSKRLGVAAMLYTLLLVCFPRAYLGYHYVSDLVAGGLVGVLVACLVNQPGIRQVFYKPIIKWQQQRPSLFYAGFFLLTYQIDDLFNSIRNLLVFTLGIGR